MHSAVIPARNTIACLIMHPFHFVCDVDGLPLSYFLFSWKLWSIFGTLLRVSEERLPIVAW